MGFWFVLIFFYIPIGVLSIKFAEIHQLGWWCFCISIPAMVLTIVIGKILDSKGG